LCILFETGLQINAVGPDIDVAFRRELALLPAFMLVSPGILEPGDGGCRKTRRILPRSAVSASPKSPVESPFRYRIGSSTSKLFDRRA